MLDYEINIQHYILNIFSVLDNLSFAFGTLRCIAISSLSFG